LFAADGFVKRIMCRISNEDNIRNVIKTLIYLYIHNINIKIYILQYEHKIKNKSIKQHLFESCSCVYKNDKILFYFL